MPLALQNVLFLRGIKRGREMGSQANITIIGVTVGAAAVILIAAAAFVLIRIYKNWSRKEPSISSLPIRTNGANATSISSSVSISVSESAHDLQTTATRNTYWGRRGQQNKDLHTSASGIPRYSYKYGCKKFSISSPYISLMF